MSNNLIRSLLFDLIKKHLFNCLQCSTIWFKRLHNPSKQEEHLIKKK